MNSRNINCLSLPKWVEDLLVGFGGLKGLDVIEVGDIGKTQITDCLVVYEDHYIKHRQELIDALTNGKLKTLLIFNTHAFLFDDSILKEIDLLSKSHDIHILCQGYFAEHYDNIKIHNFELEEHFISHHFNLLLSTKLQANKKATKTFLLQVVEKDDFRKTVVRGIMDSALSNDVVTTNRKGKIATHDLQKLHADLLDFVKNEYKDNKDVVPALDGLCMAPNFTLYEKTFCEIVVETKNMGAYHFTEKTFRPISYRVPVIFLGSKRMYDVLLGYGYKFYDNNFYEHWHDKNMSLEDKVQKLLKFMQYIKDESNAQTQMIDTAENNYQVFWNQRKLNYYQNWNSIFNEICKGKNIDRVVDRVYSRCNF